MHILEDKKICCLGLTSLFVLPGDKLPGEALGRVFKATLDLLVAYMDQVAEAAKQEDDEDADDNGMDGFQTEDEDDDEEGSDREMGDEADSVRFQKLAAQSSGMRLKFGYYKVQTRQKLFVQLRMTMITVMMRSCSHQSMRWIPLSSLWIPSKPCKVWTQQDSKALCRCSVFTTRC